MMSSFLTNLTSVILSTWALVPDGALPYSKLTGEIANYIVNDQIPVTVLPKNWSPEFS